MNAARKHIQNQLNAPKITVSAPQGRAQRYDSPRQESIAKYVLEKHKVALRELAK